MTKKTRKTHKMRKVLLTVCCAALLVCVTIGATVAYLTSTASVTNTFTVGNVNITLDEAEVNTAGKLVNADGQTEEEYVKAGGSVGGFVPAPRKTSNVYHLLPGHTYTKDPIVHVAAGSEDCWLFVKVENQIAAIEADTTIAAQMATNGWTPVANTTDIYAYKTTVSAGNDVKVFDKFTIKGTVVNEPKPSDGIDTNKQYLQDYTGKKIIVTAYAIQADGFATSDAAIAAAPFPVA